MRVSEKMDIRTYKELCESGPVTIVVFGDSVTHGALGADEISYETVYWNRLKQRLNEYNNYMPVNVINAGIGGITATGSLYRIERDVTCHNPDLVIVCFGLNDVNDPLETYIASLNTIFEKCKATGAEVILMTPNMFNTTVHPNTSANVFEYAKKTADYQNGGRMDKYMSAACDAAKEAGVTVCDCYSEWKRLEKEGADITSLLANYINHPIKEMHKLFSDMLFDTIMGKKEYSADKSIGNVMYQANK